MRAIDYVRAGQTNLLRAKLRTILTVLAITVGTFTISLTTALGTGLRDYINQQVDAYGQPNTMLLPLSVNQKERRFGPNNIPVYNPDQSSGGGMTSVTDHQITQAKQAPYITGVYPEYSAQPDYIQYNGGTKYDFQIQPIFPGPQPQLAAGSMPDASDTTKMVLPYSYLTALGFSTPQDALGKQVTLQVSQPTEKGLVTAPAKLVMLTISGVSTDTLYSPGGFVSYLLVKDWQSFQKRGDENVGALFATYQPRLTDVQVSQMKQALTNDGFNPTTFADQVSRFNNAINTAQVGMDAFAAVALFAATLGIINTLLMAVLERTQEIGLMKALGMRRRGVFGLFITEALSIGFWGGIAGVVLAMLAGRVVNPILLRTVFSGFPGKQILAFPLPSMVLIVAGAMILGLIAGVLPSIRAARLDPITALRYE